MALFVSSGLGGALLAVGHANTHGLATLVVAGPIMRSSGRGGLAAILLALELVSPAATYASASALR